MPCNTGHRVEVADFNGDGVPDLLCCGYTSTVERDIDALIYWGNRETGFRPGDFTRLRAHSSAGCLAADFNGNGYVDIAIANHKTFGDHVGESFVYWNGPEGFSEERCTRLPTSGPHDLAFAQTRNMTDSSEQEYYVSEPYHLPEGARVRRLGLGGGAAAEDLGAGPAAQRLVAGGVGGGAVDQRPAGGVAGTGRGGASGGHAGAVDPVPAGPGIGQRRLHAAGARGAGRARPLRTCAVRMPLTPRWLQMIPDRSATKSWRTPSGAAWKQTLR